MPLPRKPKSGQHKEGNNIDSAKTLLSKLYLSWTNLNIVYFVIITTLISIILSIPIAFFFISFDISESDVGGPDFSKMGTTIEVIFLACIFAPFFETFLGQAFPIRILRKYFKNIHSYCRVLVSAVLFSFGHIGYSIWYPIVVFPSAILFALTYDIFLDRKGSSFWVTFSVHSLRNLIAFLASLI